MIDELKITEAEVTILEQVLNRLVELSKTNILPYCFEEGRESGHWGETVDLIASQLGRKLSDVELICVALTRNYGPMPGLSNDVHQYLLKAMWPEGNSDGFVISWLVAHGKLTRTCIDAN